MKKLRAKIRNSVIQKLVDTGIFSLRDSHAPEARVVLGGGAVRSFINGETPNDIDIFLIGDAMGLKDIILEFLDKRYKRIFTCPEGLMFSYETDMGKLQLITPTFYTGIDHLINTFDLSPSRAVFDGEFVYLEKDFIRSVKKRICKLVNLTYPLATMNRIYKYRGYGYFVNDAQIELIRWITERSFEDENLYRRYID